MWVASTNHVKGSHCTSKSIWLQIDVHFSTKRTDAELKTVHPGKTPFTLKSGTIWALFTNLFGCCCKWHLLKSIRLQINIHFITKRTDAELKTAHQEKTFALKSSTIWALLVLTNLFFCKWHLLFKQQNQTEDGVTTPNLIMLEWTMKQCGKVFQHETPQKTKVPPSFHYSTSGNITSGGLRFPLKGKIWFEKFTDKSTFHQSCKLPPPNGGRKWESSVCPSLKYG